MEADHGHIAAPIAWLAWALRVRGQIEQSVAYSERAIRALEKWHGADHTRIADHLRNAAYGYLELGQPEKALSLNAHATELWHAALGPEAPPVALCAMTRGEIYLAMGRTSETLEAFTLSANIWKKSYGEQDHNYAMSVLGIGRARAAMGNYDAALADFARVKAILTPLVGDHGFALWGVYIETAETLLAAGRPAEALPHLEAAAKSLAGTEVDESSLGRIHFAWARALADSDPSAASDHAETARGHLARGLVRGAPYQQALTEWLAGREQPVPKP